MFLIYRDNVVEALKYLSDYNYQKTTWFENNQSLIGSYNENVMWVFDDTTLSDALVSGETIFGKIVDDALRDLEKETDKIEGDDYSEAEILHMPQMEVIRQKAAKALALVKASDGSESTVEIV
jgi:hypothetical protein